MDSDAPTETAATSPDRAAAEPSSGKAGIGVRLLAVLVALVLAFLAAVAVVASADIADLTPCDDVTSLSQLTAEGECYDGSSSEKTASLIFMWPGAALACLAVLLTLAFAVRGRGVGLAIKATVAAAALFGIGILISAI